MAITLIRRSERIRKRNEAAACSSMLRQTEKKGTLTTFSSSECERNNKIRRIIQATISPISMLPDELVMEILSRLPPKSFFCCRTICKSWLSLFSDALGLNMHFRPTLGGFFYINTSSRPAFVNLSHDAHKVEVDRTVRALSNYDILRIIDCCNGLLLIEALNMNASTIHNLYVYNPATRTLLTVWSFIPLSGHDWFYQTFSLAFDPRVYSQFHIICFSSWNDIDGETFSFLDIFSFERGKCTSQKELACDDVEIYSKGTFIDGRVYRITIHGRILSICANECSYQVINPPDHMTLNYAYDKIGQSQGLLHYLALCDKKGLLFIWVLKSHTQQEWTLKYQLSLDKIYYSVPQPHCDVSYIYNRMILMGHFAFHPEKDILFMPVGCNHLMSLDLSTGKRTELVNLDEKIATGPWVYLPCYLI